MGVDATLSISEVADLLFSARERIDFYWNFYIGLIVAVVGWLIAEKRTLSTRSKVIAMIAFVLAAGMNLSGLYSSYTLAAALRDDLLRMTPAETALRETRSLLEQHSYVVQRTVALWTHFLFDGGVLALLWSLRRPSDAEEVDRG